MNILFLLGNGFDINSGLDTSYRTIIDAYCSSDSDSRLIEEFKNDISSWSEFELKMANYISKFNTEEEFITVVRDFKKFLNLYLSIENKKYKVDKGIKYIIVDEIEKSLDAFYKKGTPNVRNAVSDMLRYSSLKYDFISFNYTDCFDSYLIEAADNLSSVHNDRNKQVHINASITHIHGLLNNNVTIGVDNKEQFSESDFPISQRILRAFVKPSFIVQTDERKFETAINLINNADVICTFGLSFGQSDAMWINLIKKWLEEKEFHHLFFYDYDFSQKSISDLEEKIAEEEIAKDRFKDKILINNDEILNNRIHIPVASNIFNIGERISELSR